MVNMLLWLRNTLYSGREIKLCEELQFWKRFFFVLPYYREAYPFLGIRIEYGMPSICSDPVTHDDEKHEQKSGAVGSIESRVNGIVA